MLKPNPKAIGTFVVGGLVLFVLGLVTFGSFKFFAQRLPVVMYFSGDMTGLDEGAPLVFRGVRIGTITDVQLFFNAATRDITIPVHAEIEPERFVVEGETTATGQNVPKLVQAGLRAQLASQSLLTGKLLVQVDFFPDTPIKLHGQAGGPVEIPTVPSAMAELKASLAGVLKKVQDVPLPELVEDLRRAINDADVAIRQLDTKKYGEVAQAAIRTLDDIRGLVGNLNEHLDELAPASLTTIKDADQAVLQARQVLTDMRPLLAKLQRTADSANNLMNTAQDAIQPGSPAYRELVATLKEFSNTARSIRALTDDLERNPNSILFGKAPVRSAK